MTNTTEKMIEIAKAHPAVASVNVWKGKRAYINLHAMNRGFRGDRSHQFYIDLATGEMIDQRGKGTLSDAFAAATDEVADAVRAAS